MFDDADFRSFFSQLTGRRPYDYQVQVARLLADGQHVILRAPTGAGKTWATLAPFLYLRDKGGPTRVIYALPLRTLAQGIYREARERLEKFGLSPGLVTIQTGEQPDDEFLQAGTVIVTTYDQVLSGLLHGPYGLSDRLHNINAAAMAGAVVVFDEFHLMEPDRAFLTAVAGQQLYRHLSQSVWMTATATSALEAQIRDALGARTVPENEAERLAMFEALPSVTDVRRHWRFVDVPLSASAVMQAHRQRSIVIVNTVKRAQAIYEALNSLRKSEGRTFELVMLHSQFFKTDRERKEQRLRELFGLSSNASAILVATQVVEAGIDITCEQLHTELCPMSALIQRAGRCARYAGETGTVHVYLLPDEDRNWLPYGDLERADPALRLTEATLRQAAPPHTDGWLDPATAAYWVQAVHYDADYKSVRDGWTSRRNTIVTRIAENVSSAKKVGIADLIREESLDQVRVIVADASWLPDAPGERESVTVSRWNLRAAVRDALAVGTPAGWVYDWTLEPPWRDITDEADLKGAYVVCLPPQIARYDPDSGLHLGDAGSALSPIRTPPKRPGYGTLRHEPWTEHARLVAREAERRLTQCDNLDGGMLGRGFLHRYGLPPAGLRDAVRATALLHDLGKLRNQWQNWAERVQTDRDPAYRHTQSLAHTDYDPKNPADREREQRFRGERPPHAAPGAFYAPVVLPDLLPNVPPGKRIHVLAACVAAILGHHGSWIPSQATGMNLDIDDGLASDWQQAVSSATGRTPNARVMMQCVAQADKRRPLEEIVKLVADEGAMQEWWPLVAYLTRTLRLSDQRATAEGAGYGDQ